MYISLNKLTHIKAAYITNIACDISCQKHEKSTKFKFVSLTEPFLGIKSYQILYVHEYLFELSYI